MAKVKKTEDQKWFNRKFGIIFRGYSEEYKQRVRKLVMLMMRCSIAGSTDAYNELIQYFEGVATKTERDDLIFSACYFIHVLKQSLHAA